MDEAKFRREFRSESHLRWLKKFGCFCGAPATDAHHVKSRGAGGTWKDLVPLCWRHHREGHQIGWKTFEKRYEINLREAADWFVANAPQSKEEEDESFDLDF